MTTEKKLNKRRDELAPVYMTEFRKHIQNDHLYPWVAAQAGYEVGFNTLVPTWLKMYEALKEIDNDPELETGISLEALKETDKFLEEK